MRERLSGLWRLCRQQFHRDHQVFGNFPPGPYRVILDIGAHAGEFARRAQRHFRPERVCLVEADPELAESLRHRFGSLPGYKVVAAAIADRTGEMDFHINEHRAASSLLPMHGQTRTLFDRPFREQKVVKVATVTLDELFLREGWDQVDLMKVDIQGGERALLVGGQRALRQVRVIYLEVLFQQLYENCALFCELHETLSRGGFHLQFLDDFRRGKEGDLIYGNACYRRV